MDVSHNSPLEIRHSDMKSLELFLNLLHYSIFMVFYKLTLFFNSILGIKTNSELHKLVGYRRFGTDLIYAGGFTIGIFSFALIIIGNLLKGFFGVDGKLSVAYFIIMGLISILSCFYLIFKKERYLCYFEYFDKKPSSVRRAYLFTSLVCVVMILSLLIYSFRF